MSNEPSVYDIARSRIASSEPEVPVTKFKPVRTKKPAGMTKKEYDHEYYMQHREEHIAKVKAWRAKNQDKMQVYEKDYYHRHRDECIEKNKAWAKANPEKRREAGRRCYHKHSKEYNKRHAERARGKRAREREAKALAAEKSTQDG